MILQTLVHYYEALADRNEIARPGWANTKVSHALEIGDNGELLSILPLKTPDATGKKFLPRELELPEAVKRTADVASNFVWDNAIYLLGLDTKGRPERAIQCFEAAKDLHLQLLGDSDDPFAKAVCAFFASWSPADAAENPIVAAIADELSAGGNLVFMHKYQYPTACPALKAAWQRHYDNAEDGAKMRCLITGENIVPLAVHPAIKNVRDAQGVGAAIVSFNAASFCSFNREQSLNAPIGKYAAFAYTTALNRLLADRDHVVYIGDASVIFWAESAEKQYQDAFMLSLNGAGNNDNSVSDNNIQHVLSRLAQGKEVDWNGVPLNPDNRFYILGLSPNAARLSVRFFLQDSFGNFARHSQEHYERLVIAKPAYEKTDDMLLWKLMRETVNPNATDKKSTPQMSGDVLRAILTGGRYPATLYQAVQLRIRADRNISYRRAAIIKAYLLRNTTNEALKEVLTVQLNDQTTYQPYVLGRLFAVLEQIQDDANPGLNATIKDKYLSSACATPAMVFPILLNLAQKHLRKIKQHMGIYVNDSKQLTTLTALLTESFPKHHTLEEQGAFQLGYYHQTQKRYESKNKEENPNE